MSLKNFDATSPLHVGLATCHTVLRLQTGELVGNMAGPEYERDDVDCAFGVVDRIDHRSENFVAVAQYLDRVALCGVQSEKRMHAIDPFTGGCRYS